MTRILTVMGSERRDKNTAFFLDYVLQNYMKRFAENQPPHLTKIVLRSLRFSPCISCQACERQPSCAVKDDMTAIYPEIERADVIFFASPIYFNCVSAVSKAFIDRMQMYWARKCVLQEPPLKEKSAYILLDGGARYYPTQFQASALVFDYFFKALHITRSRLLGVSYTDVCPLNAENTEFLAFCREAMTGAQQEAHQMYIFKNREA